MITTELSLAISRLEEKYQEPIKQLLSVLVSLDLPMNNVLIFFLIFQKVPEGIFPMMFWLKEQIVDKSLTEKELTYSVLMNQAILIARRIEGSLPESAEKSE